MAAQAKKGKRRSLDALGKAGAEAHLEVVDGDVVEHRVWARQVDVLKDAGVDPSRDALFTHQLARLCVTCAVCSGPCLHSSLPGLTFKPESGPAGRRATGEVCTST